MTRIAELLAEQRTISFEFFPPKTEEAERQLEKTLAELAPLAPDFVSVTYGALGSTRENTRDLVVGINRDYPFPAMAHLTCVGHSKGEIVSLLNDYRAAGVENILALAGDPPADGSEAGGDFTHAIDLVELVRDAGDFSIGVAAFPELHPRSDGDRDHDRRHLAEKLRVSDFGITQFFFEIEAYTEMVDELADLGCETPVLPGVFPFTNVAGLRRMAGINGTVIPRALDERLDAIGSDPEQVRQLGVDVATELCEQLLEAGVPGLHLYALNRSESVTEILRRLGLRSD